jgi:hypothetical protein
MSIRSNALSLHRSCLALSAAVLGLTCLRVAHAQNFLERPFLGKTCSEEGPDCANFPARFFDFEFNLQQDLSGNSRFTTWAMLRPELDPNLPSSWGDTAALDWSGNSGMPASDIVAENAAMRIFNPPAGFEGWFVGGLGRGVATRFNSAGFFHEYMEARFRDATGQLRPYPGAWNIAGQPLDPASSPRGTPGRSVFLLADASVTPADNVKFGNFLTRKRASISNPTADTTAYYRRICNTPSSAAPCSNAQLDTLTAFRQRFGMQTSDSGPPAAGETVATYYNRGDLGIGREMHCIQQASTQDIACYVKNFGQFGAPPSWSATAFEGSPFATVAMVERHSVSPTSPDKVIFLVYGGNGQLVTQAPLDQHSSLQLGQDGVNFNAHIPSNCMACHGAGGQYVPQNASNVASRGATGAMFLPFDLDQFEYHPTNASLSRSSQETAFRILNVDIVRRVAATYGSTRAGAIINTVNGWYGIDPSRPHQEQSLTFVSSYVPPGWGADLWDGFYGDSHFYQKLLRPYCRGCHMTFGLDDSRSFEDWEQYDRLWSLASFDMCPQDNTPPRMPHAEQVSREFWDSDARSIFVAYTSWTGTQVKDCVPGPNR